MNLCYNKHRVPRKPEARLKEAFQICHDGIIFRHRGVNSTLAKFQRTFFVLSARDKIRRPVECCDICFEFDYFSCRLRNYLRMPRTTHIFRNPLKTFSNKIKYKKLIKKYYKI